MSQFLLNKYCTLWRYETGPQFLQSQSPCLHRFSWSWPPSGISSLTILHLCPQSYVHGTSPSSSSFQALRKRWPASSRRLFPPCFWFSSSPFTFLQHLASFFGDKSLGYFHILAIEHQGAYLFQSVCLLSSVIYTEVGLLHNTAVLIFWGPSILFSSVAAPNLYFDCVLGFPLLYIPANIYYLLSIWW